MKHHFTIFLALSLLASSPVLGQTTLLTDQTYSVFNQSGATPKLGDSVTHNYNSIYQKIESIKWLYSAGIPSWKLFARWNYSFDSTGNLFTNTYQNWDTILNVWKNSWRITNTFDGNNLLVSSGFEFWNGTDWALNNTSTWTYNANGKVLTEDFLLDRYTYVYNAAGLLEIKTQQTSQNGPWENHRRTSYSYVSGDTKLLSTTIEKWANNSWVNNSRSSYTYDANGDAVAQLDETWANNFWNSANNTSFSYNANHQFVHWIQQKWSGTSWGDYTYQAYRTYDDQFHILKSRLEIWYDSSWQVRELYDYYYTEFVSTHAPSVIDFQVFPNPATNSVMLQGEGLTHVQLFDPYGRLVGSQSLSEQGQETMQLGNLPTGNYILQVSGKNGKIGAKPLQITH